MNKLVLLPVLKDHGSAGVTGALKNMSHGLVNNVNRSHSTPDTNVCNQFIPQVVNHPIIRKKCVLQIMDGIKGVFQGGPGASRPDWTWENNALFFATDPVAMDLEDSSQYIAVNLVIFNKTSNSQPIPSSPGVRPIVVAQDALAHLLRQWHRGGGEDGFLAIVSMSTESSVQVFRAKEGLVDLPA